jgi:hypothetical protein
MRILTLALVLVAAFVPLACGSFDPPYRPGVEIEVHDMDMIWERARLVLESDGYRIEEADTKRADLEMHTRWQTMLAPNRFEGIRRRVSVKFVQLQGDRLRVDLRVLQERNAEITQPLNPIAADWEEDPRAETGQREEVLLYKIESAFAGDRPE